MTAGIVSKKIRGAGALATLGVLAYPVVPFIIVCKLALMDPGVFYRMHIHLGVRQLCAVWRQKIRKA